MAAAPLPDAGSAALLTAARAQAAGALRGTPAPLDGVPAPARGVSIPRGAHAPVMPVSDPAFWNGVDAQTQAAIAAGNQALATGAPAPVASLPSSGLGLVPVPAGPSPGALSFDQMQAGMDDAPDTAGPSAAAMTVDEADGDFGPKQTVSDRLKALNAAKKATPGFWSAAGHEALAGFESIGRALTPVASGLANAVSAGQMTLPGGGMMPSSAAMNQAPIVVTPKATQTVQDRLKSLAKQQAQKADQSPGVGGWTGRVLGGVVPFAMQPELYSGADLINAYNDARARGDSRTTSALSGVLQGSLDEFLGRFGGSGKVAEKFIPWFAAHPVIAKAAQAAAGATGAQVGVEELRRHILSAAGDQKGAAEINPFDAGTIATFFLTPFAVEGFGHLVGSAVSKARGRTASSGPSADAVPAMPPGAPETAAAPSTPTPPPEGGENAPVPDQPTPEPQRDILAQWDDMLDDATPRKGVLLPKGQVIPESLVGPLATARSRGRVVSLSQGDLVLRTAKDALKVRNGLKAGMDSQQVIGAVTGAGTGKTPEQTLVLQGRTPAGAVATEGVVTPQEVAGRVAAVQAQGKTPVVTTPPEALARRQAEIAAEPADEESVEEALPPQLAMAKIGDADVPVQIVGDAGNGQTRVQVLDEHGEPGEERVIPTEALGTRPEATAQPANSLPPRERVEEAHGFRVGGIYRVHPEAAKRLGVVPGERARIRSIWRDGENEPYFARASLEQSGAQTGFELPHELEHIPAASAEDEPLKPLGRGPWNPTEEMERKPPAYDGDLRKYIRSRILHDLRPENYGGRRTVEAIAGNNGDPRKGPGYTLTPRDVQPVLDELVSEGRITKRRGAYELAGDEGPTTPGAEEKPAKPRKAPTAKRGGLPAPDATRDTALKYLAKLGGVDINEAESEGFDPADMSTHRAGIRRAFHSKGMTIEDAGEALAQDGWDVTDPHTGGVDKDKVLKVIDDELHGRPHYSSRRDLERFAEDEEADRRLRAEFDRVAPEHTPVYDAQPEPVRDFTALADRARQIDPDATERALEVDSDDEAERRLQEIINGTQTQRANETDTGAVARGTREGEREPAHIGRGARSQEGASDLFGDDTRAAQALADETRRRDAARNSGQESIETGRPDDLFSQARRQTDLTDELEAQRARANRLLDDTTRRLDATGFRQKLARLRDSGTPESLHALLDEIGRQATGPARAIVGAIRRHVIDTPVRFVDELRRPDGSPVSPSTAGLHVMGLGQHEIQIRLDHPYSHPVRSLLHEAVHAATSAHLRMEPDSDFARELERLRQIAVERTERQLGRKLTDADLRGKLYGLRNLREFVAEALSNDAFQQHLIGSDRFAGSRDRVVRILHRLGAAIRRLLGIPQHEAPLFDNVLFHTGRLMEAQGRMNDRLARLFASDERSPQVRDVVDAMTDAEQFQTLSDALEDEPDRIHGEDRLIARAPGPIRDIVRQQLRLARRATHGSIADWMRKGVRGFATEDQLLLRAIRHFGSDDQANPIRRYMAAKARRLALRTTAVEPSRAVAARWARLTKAQNEELGALMRDATIWKIDPAKPDTEQLVTMSRRRDFPQRYAALRQRYEQLSSEQQGIYHDVLRDNNRLARLARRAAIDSVLESVGISITPAQKSILYAIKDPRQLDQIIGPGLAVDLNDHNELVRSSIRQLSPMVEGDFPYFHLGRQGTKVVTIAPEGERNFATREDAERFAEQVRSIGPSARAFVLRNLDRWQVAYHGLRYAAFHKTAAAAEEDVERLRGLGFEVGPVTEKLLATHGGDTRAIGHLIGEARRRIRKFGNSGGPAEQAAAEGLERILGATWNSMMADQAERIGASMRRRGVAGIPGSELRAAYARHVLSVANHVATLRTIFEQSDALGRIQEASRDAEIGHASQKTMYARGYLFHELARRIQQDSEAHQAGAAQEFLSQLVAANYLISPAHAAIWALQPATVGMPVLSSRFGIWRTGRAFTKAMGWAARPAVRGLMRNLAARAEGYTDSDVAETLASAAAHDPALARWVPQIRELGARGVFTHGYTNMLTDMGRGPGGHMRAAMQVGWALPQLGDTLSRITTALAGLELTNGNVEKTADLVHETMLNYDASNRPRHFKTLDRGGLRFITSLQSYTQGILHLLATHAYDAITGAGHSRPEALKTLAGMALMSSVFAGLGGTTAGPVSWFANGIHHAIFPNDPYDFRTALHDWLTDHFGHTAGDLAYYGLPYGIGVNLSHRIGIGDLFRSFDDLAQATNWEQTLGAIGQIAFGPLGSGIEQHWKSFNRYAERGDWGEALASLVPIKAWDDALKGADLMRHGYQGNSVTLPPLGAGAATTQGLGFQPSSVAKVQSKAEALYRLNQQRYARKAEILRDWLAAHNKAPSIGQIRRFNQENPGVAITYADFLRAARQQARAVRMGAGRSGRDPTLNRMLDY